MLKKNYALPALSKNKLIYNASPDSSNFTFRLYFSPQGYLAPTTENAFKEVLTTNIFWKLIQKRFTFLSRKYFSGEQNVNVIPENITIGNVTLSLSIADPSSGGIENKINTVTRELGQIRHTGFTKAELQEMIQAYLKFVDNYPILRNASNSEQLVGEITGDYLGMSYDIDPQTFCNEARKLLSQITLQDINREVNKWFGNQHFVAYLNGPGDSTSFKVGQLLNSIEASIYYGSAISSTTPDNPMRDTTLDLKLQPGKVVSELIDTLNGVLTYRLSNGITAYLNYKYFDPGNITFSAVKSGGYKKYGVSDYENAAGCVNIVNAMGYGAFPYQKANKLLQDNKVNLSHVVNESYFSTDGISYSGNLEELLKLNALMLLHPRYDPVAFRQYIQVLQNKKSKIPGSKAGAVDTVARFFAGPNPYLKGMFDASKISWGKTVKIYQDQFGDAAGWHYSFAGKIDTTQFRYLIEKYLGGLPTNSSEPGKVASSDISLPNGKFVISLRDDSSPNGHLLKYYYGRIANSPHSIFSLLLLKMILKKRMFAILREQNHLIYNGEVDIKPDLDAIIPGYTCTFDIFSNPKDLEKVSEVLDSLIADISRKGPTNQELLFEKNIAFMSYERMKLTNKEIAINTLHNKFWGIRTSYYLMGKALREITKEDIRQAAKQIMVGNELTVIINPNPE